MSLDTAIANAINPPPIAFELVRYNPRRRARNVAAAQVKVTVGDEPPRLLWMDRRDLALNIREFGDHEGLRAAQRAYTRNKPIPETEASSPDTES